MACAQIAFGEAAPDPGRGDDLSTLIFFPMDNGDAKSVFGTCSAKVIRGSLTGLAEVKVISGYRMGDPQAVYQDVFYKGIRLYSGELLVERQNQCAVQAESLKEIQFLRGRCQSEHRSRRIEHRPRMRLEGHGINGMMGAIAEA